MREVSVIDLWPKAGFKFLFCGFDRGLFYFKTQTLYPFHFFGPHVLFDAELVGSSLFENCVLLEGDFDAASFAAAFAVPGTAAIGQVEGEDLFAGLLIWENGFDLYVQVLESVFGAVFDPNDQIVEVVGVFDCYLVLLNCLVSPGVVFKGRFVVVNVVGATSAKQEGKGNADGQSFFHRRVLMAQSDIY